MNKDYVCGFLDNVGCIYIKHMKKRGYFFPMFIVATKNQDKNKIQVLDKVFDWLNKNKDIEFTKHLELNNTKLTFRVSQAKSLYILLMFIKENCLLPKDNAEKALDIVTLRLGLRKPTKKEMEEVCKRMQIHKNKLYGIINKHVNWK